MDDFQAAWRARFGVDPPDGLPDAGETLARILGRASCRQFRPDPIDAGLLSLLLACAQSAPSKSDLQQYSIVVIDDPAIRSAMQEWSSFDAWIGDAPVFLVFCGDLNRQRRISELHGFDHRNDSLDTFMNTAVDAGIALASFVLAAEAAGLGCCPISVVRNHIAEACDLLGLPPGVFPVAGLALGHVAAEAQSTVSMRLPPSAVIHRNRYDSADLDTAIAAYDARRHATAPIPPGKQRHVDRYGVKQGLTWSENAARQMSVPERTGFAAFLKGRGFALD
ncbi:MAG: nitroreductase family protein [Alphaproteobacteria bacterium]|nr:nitroreductase family protein [Alphaproteobacteria bacterium]